MSSIPSNWKIHSVPCSIYLPAWNSYNWLKSRCGAENLLIYPPPNWEKMNIENWIILKYVSLSSAGNLNFGHKCLEYIWHIG